MDYDTLKMHSRDRRHNHRSHTRSMSPPSRPRSNNRDHDKIRDRSRSRSRKHRPRRSRSPLQSSQNANNDRKREQRQHHGRKELSPVSAAPPVLPYNARQLSKRDLSQLEPMFAMYLDIQKGLLIDDLNEEEVKGRWKSFIKKWNRGELAEGWYDPATFEKAKNSLKSEDAAEDRRIKSRPSPSLESLEGHDQENAVSSSKGDDGTVVNDEENEDEDEDEDEVYGPKLPTGALTFRGLRSGPTIPRIEDLELQREQAFLDAQSARSASHAQHKLEISSHKTQQRAFEDEVAPRAEPGTHDRKMEKKREKAAANREFASSRRGGSPALDAPPEAELLGGGGDDDDLEALKKVREQEMRKKSERERRREEILMARKAEREERLAEYRKKEDETMGWLKALAKQRFG